MALAWSQAPADGPLHETLDPHRRAVNGGRQTNPGSHCRGHRDGTQMLTLRRAVCGRRTNVELEKKIIIILCLNSQFAT